MYTKQIAIFLENKKGRLAEVTKLLTDERINIRALTLADTVEFGVLRLIVNDHARCLAALKAHGLAAQETQVLSVEMDDRPGGLHRVVEALDAENVNVEYMYTFFGKKGDSAIVVFKPDDASQAVSALAKHQVRILPEDMIQNL
jgi:hypothetical protein